MHHRLLVPLLAMGCGGASPQKETVKTGPRFDDSGASDTAGTDSADLGHPDTGDRLPEPPAELTRWLVGNPADHAPPLDAPLALLGGGGTDVRAAMEEWLAAAAGGDVVVLRTSGEDGYNDWLYSALGGVDSVETLRVDSRSLADDPYVAWRVDTAEAVFMAGGDQWTYLDRWTDTALHHALTAAWGEGRSVGGTSAGAAVLGTTAFSAEVGSITSAEALADPYDMALTLETGFLALPPLDAVVVDTHFYERDRFGRLLVFLARALADGAAPPIVGIGVDEGTAVVVEADGTAQVRGDGYAYVITARSLPTACTPGTPLSVSDWTYRVVHPGDALDLPSGTGDGPIYPIDVVDGVLVPDWPY